MEPRIDSTQFGTITIEGNQYSHDIIIRLDGQVKKRKKKLSKAIYGTSHVVSLDEAKHIYEPNSQALIIGTGQYGMLTLSDEAKGYFDDKKCQLQLLPTPEAIRVWNQSKGAVVGVFHITC